MSGNRKIVDTIHRHTTIADHIANLCDQAGIAVTVTFPTEPPPAGRYGLAELARVLDDAGLINDTRVGDQR